MNLFDPHSTTEPAPAMTLDRHDIRRLRERFQRATKIDRYVIKQELTAVMVKHGEATDNSTAACTRLPRATIATLDRLATEYDTTASALIRESVLWCLEHGLYTRRTPTRAEEED